MQNNVEFDDELFGQGDALLTSRKREKMPFSLISLVLKFHIASNEAQAKRVLMYLSLTLFLTALVITLYFVFDIGRPKNVRYYTAEQRPIIPAPK